MQPIAGATSDDYTPVAADVGTDIVFRVTASATGYTDGVAQLQPARGRRPSPRQRRRQMSAPSGTGVGAGLVGRIAPAWNQSDVTTTYQWLRNGSPICGAHDR